MSKKEIALYIVIAIVAIILLIIGVKEVSASETSLDVQSSAVESIAVDMVANVEQAPINVEPFEGESYVEVRHSSSGSYTWHAPITAKQGTAEEWKALQRKIGAKETGVFDYQTYLALVKFNQK